MNKLEDGSNWEWRHYHDFLPSAIVTLSLHSLMFNAVGYFVSDAKPFVQQILRTLLSIPLNVYCFGWYPVVTTIPQGIFIYTIARFTKLVASTSPVAR